MFVEGSEDGVGSAIFFYRFFRGKEKGVIAREEGDIPCMARFFDASISGFAVRGIVSIDKDGIDESLFGTFCDDFFGTFVEKVEPCSLFLERFFEVLERFDQKL